MSLQRLGCGGVDSTWLVLHRFHQSSLVFPSLLVPMAERVKVDASMDAEACDPGLGKWMSISWVVMVRGHCGVVIDVGMEGLKAEVYQKDGGIRRCLVGHVWLLCMGSDPFLSLRLLWAVSLV